MHRLPPRRALLIADRGYGPNHLRDAIAERGAAPNIPPKVNRRLKLCLAESSIEDGME